MDSEIAESFRSEYDLERVLDSDPQDLSKVTPADNLPRMHFLKQFKVQIFHPLPSNNPSYPSRTFYDLICFFKLNTLLEIALGLSLKIEVTRMLRKMVGKIFKRKIY